jgi:hypothetical protein
MRLLKDQTIIAKDNLSTTIFVEGVAGTGKTTAAIERVKQLLKNGVRPDSILVLVPSSILAVPYRESLQRSHINTTDIHTATLGKLAYQMVKLFFPLVSEEAAFAHPHDEPHFLSLELVQYYMTRFIEPTIEEKDYFNSVRINRNRLYTQIIDNLNKSVLMDFPINTLATRLKSAWRGDVEQDYIYEDAQVTGELFRERCKQHNMLDFSLQVELFVKHLWEKPQVRNYLFNQYKHLIVDNLEEDNPTTHRIIREWLQHCDSATLIYDHQGGFRRFLGADPKTAYQLKSACDVHVSLTNHRIMSPDLEAFRFQLASSLNRTENEKTPSSGDVLSAIVYENNRFHTDMINWVVEEVNSLINNDGVSPSEIVILAPYVTDALRFSLQSRFNELDIPNSTHRPSRMLRDEPTARSLLTLAKIAHPQWGLNTSDFEVANALMTVIEDLDLVRARLITRSLYKEQKLLTFKLVTDETALERITFSLGMYYDRIVEWIENYHKENELPIDIFLSKLFGEVLSHAGYSFFENIHVTNTVADLIDSCRDFRQTVNRIEPDVNTSIEYVRMFERGVIANRYTRDWSSNTKSESVLISPAFTFLQNNRPVDYQFWLKVGSSGWSQRLYQPLTHPYVLNVHWELGRIWTDIDELNAEQETLASLTMGLVRRCRKKVYLGISEFGERGYQQRGPLIMAIQSMLRQLQERPN